MPFIKPKDALSAYRAACLNSKEASGKLYAALYKAISAELPRVSRYGQSINSEIQIPRPEGLLRQDVYSILHILESELEEAGWVGVYIWRLAGDGVDPPGENALPETLEFRISVRCPEYGELRA